MRGRAITRQLWQSVLLALSLLAAAPASAEEVRREHLGLDLLANLELPAGRPLEGSAVVLIVHGTLAHHGMEIVRALQAGLRERGLASLAMTLSLGRNARRGMLECGVEHEHRMTDAAEEIGAWVDWLKQKQVARIALLGHSRGAQQVAHYAVGEPDALVDRLVLVAPPVDTAAETADRYRSAFSADLPALLAKARGLAEAGEEDSLIDMPGFLHCRAARVTAATVLDYYDPDGAHHVPSLLRRIVRPVLVVAAGADQVSPSVGQRLSGAGLGAHVTIRTLEGADHMFQDLFAEDLADAVKVFVAP